MAPMPIMEVVMAKLKLESEIARLESENDHLLSEIVGLNELMRKIGFSEGIKTIKATAKDMLRQSDNTQDNEEYEDS